MTEHMSAKDYQKMISTANGSAMSDDNFIKTVKGKQLEYANRINNPLRGASDQNNSMTRSTEPRKHEEDDLTKQVAEYCDVLLLQKKITAFSHIPQETFTKSWVTKAKNKAMGVRSGVPDMLIVYPHAVLFLELKKEKGGKLSDSQDLWIKALSSTGKVTAIVAAGWDQAEAAINSLLE